MSSFLTKQDLITALKETHLSQSFWNDFHLDIVRGKVPGHSYINNYGYNAAVGASEEPIWAESGVQYPYLTASTRLVVSSNNAEDTGSSTRAWTVFFEGLDGNFNYQSESVTMNGQAGVSTSLSYYRVRKITTLTAGSGGKNAGIIYSGWGTLTTGKPVNVSSHMIAGTNTTLLGIATIPAGYTGYMHNWNYSSDGAGEARLYTRNSGSVFVLRRRMPVVAGDPEYNFQFALIMPEKSDIEVRGLASVATDAVGTTFEIHLISSSATI